MKTTTLAALRATTAPVSWAHRVGGNKMERKERRMTTKRMGAAAGALAAAVLMIPGLGGSGEARAATVSTVISGTDCSGYFGTPFESCEVFAMSYGNRVGISPVIIKYDTKDGSTVIGAGDIEVNTSKYPSIDNTEFTFSALTVDDNEVKGGTWTYVPGIGDPGVRFWAAKAGNDFQLFWDVDQSVISGGTCAAGVSVGNNTFACLSAANVVTTGTFTTPGNKGLSHITFYDTAGPAVIPIPAALPMLGAAVAGLGLAGWRRRRAAV
jgi:hypothetical protein